MDPKIKRIKRLLLDAEVETIAEAAKEIRVHKSTLWRAIHGKRAGASTGRMASCPIGSASPTAICWSLTTMCGSIPQAALSS